MKEFGASRSDIMLAPTMAILMMRVLSPVAGWAMDRFPAPAFVSIGASLFSLSFFSTSQATAVWQIVVVYGLLIAAGEAMAGPMTAQILTTKWFTQRRGLALGISATGISAGGIVFPPLATALTAAHGWREAQLLGTFTRCCF
jgi:MFS family permease